MEEDRPSDLEDLLKLAVPALFVFEDLSTRYKGIKPRLPSGRVSLRKLQSRTYVGRDGFEKLNCRKSADGP
jgi:hypothetical protein